MSKKSKKSAKTKSKQAAPIRHRKIAWVLRYIPVDMLVLVSALTAGLFIRWWPLEFVVSYLPQILIVFWVYLMIYAAYAVWFIFVHDLPQFVERIGKLSLTGLGISLMIGIFVVAYSLNIVTVQDAARSIDPRSDALTIGTFNKLYKSQNFLDDANAVSAIQVDVFSLQEVDENEIDIIRKRVNHGYSYVTDCDCSAKETEVGLISRYPIINALTIYEHENSVIARTVIHSEQHGEFVVYLVHMHVPYTSESYALREGAYQKLSDAVNSETIPTFVLGDFNTTVYSPDMQNFMKDTPGIENVITRSWPRCSWFGIGELACARIDYVFAPTGSTAQSLEIGGQAFSDHRAVTAQVSF